jgi:hypothetical protein
VVVIADLAHAVADVAPLLDRQRYVALGVAAAVVVVVFELMRRRKLREEYSWVWVATAAFVAVLALEGNVLTAISAFVGSSSPVWTLFFGAMVFLLALALQFSVRLSRLTHRHRTLGQRVALLEAEIQRLREQDAGERAPERRAGERATPNRARDIVA